MPKIEMNLADYLRVLRKRKRIIILSFILAVVLTYFYTSRQIPIYSASCKVKVEQRKSVAEILTELITWSPGDEMASQANLIKSFQIMEKAADRLGLINPTMKPEERMAGVKELQGQIQTGQVESTNIIAITATSTDPEHAVTLANAVAQVYVEAHFENKKKEASNVKTFVKNQLDYYLAELQKSESALQRFRHEYPLVAERDIKSLSLAESDPQVSALKAEIVKLELELISLKSRYTDEHPEVMTLKRRIEESKKDLSDTLSQITTQQKELSTKEVELIQLKRNVTTEEEIYSMFKKKYEEASILEAEKVQDVTIIEPASPMGPINSNMNFSIIIGVIGGLLIGLIMAFVTESLDTTIGRIDDIEELTKVPVLGVIPSTSLEKRKRHFVKKFKKREQVTEKDELHKRLITIFEPASVAAEAFKALRTHLNLIASKKNGNCIVITSAAPEEGKTQTLCNLAIAMAQGGQKVLIVGSDFRKPMIHNLFGLKRSPGLIEILMGNVSWKKAVNTTVDMLIGGIEYERILNTQGIENLHVITSGEPTANPAELLNLPQMDDLIKELKQSFDVVLLDSPPTLPVTDSAILGPKTDGVIFIYQAGKTSRYALIRAKTQLKNVNAKILGIVINNLKAEFIEDVTPYQRYRYYGYYREKEQK